MFLKQEKIIIIKRGLTGEASVKYNLFNLNKIIIDTSSPVDPVSIAKYDGSPVVGGQLVTELKEEILEFFQETLGEAPDGIYEFLPVTTIQVNKI